MGQRLLASLVGLLAFLVELLAGLRRSLLALLLRKTLLALACRRLTGGSGDVEIGGFAFSLDPIGRVPNNETGYEHKNSRHGEEDEAHSQLVKGKVVSFHLYEIDDASDDECDSRRYACGPSCLYRCELSSRDEGGEAEPQDYENGGDADE